MKILVNFLVIFVGILHVGFLYLEMFLWKTSVGMQIFKTDVAFAERSAALAANQGLYNGFLAAGLFYSFFTSEQQSFQLRMLFLTFVVIAGIYGAMTVSPRIFFIQAVPAIIAILAVFFSR